MEKHKDQLIFDPTGTLVAKEQLMRTPEINGKYGVWLQAEYENGHIYTKEGTPVDALRVVKNSVQLHVIELDPEYIIPAPNRRGPLATRYGISSYSTDNHVVTTTIAEPIEKIIVPDMAPLLKNVTIEPAYNAFGYCFAGSQFWLPDPSIVIKEEFERTDNVTEADKIVLMAYDWVDDFGNDAYYPVHAVNRNQDGTISFKPEFKPLVQNAPMSQLRYRHNGNHEVFLRAAK